MSSQNKNTTASVSPKGAKKVTIYDLARHTGFSPGTVSRVLNNRDRVKPETRERILQAAKELDLKPQVSVRSRQVAIISEPTYTDRIEGYAATLTAHLAFAASRRNMGIVLPSDPFEQLPGLFLDGIIVVTSNQKLLRLVGEMEERIPVIYMDHFEKMEGRYRVCSDHYRSGYLAAEHFLARGKKHPAFFGGEGQAFSERLRGFKDALMQSAHPLNEKLYVQASAGTHQAVITRLVRAGADAVYVPGTSFQAMECLHLLTYIMGLSVPDDISLIGGENEGISEIQCPPLTTVEEPLKEMAEVAVEMLDQCTGGDPVTQPSQILPVKLIERNSVS
ncbi:MAG: LacI family DNA-binding transcriptional regulator [Opitutales bacterium]|nr:LacI family DNA-binding transcriptional regulator [Opitutales bacterium]